MSADFDFVDTRTLPIEIGSRIWEHMDDHLLYEANLTPRGGTVVEIIEPSVDLDTGEMRERTYVVLERIRGSYHFMWIPESMVMAPEPPNTYYLRENVKGVLMQLAKVKGAFSRTHCDLEGAAHRLFGRAVQ